MNKMLAWILLSCLLGGCTIKKVAVGDDGHYVVAETRWTGKTVIMDCHSLPPGSDAWDPTCKKAKVEK